MKRDEHAAVENTTVREETVRQKSMTFQEYLDMKGIEITPLAEFPPEPEPKRGSPEPADNDVYEYTFCGRDV